MGSGPREFQGLVEDIRSRGVVVDLLVTKDGLLLDGHRRLAAVREAGLSKLPAKTFDFESAGSTESAISIAVNLFRRNLSEAQRVALGSSLLRIERVKAEECQRGGQKRGGETAATRRTLVENVSPQAVERDRATERAAAAVGVSRKTFEKVEAVKRNDPELARRMLEGSLSVDAA
jgi:ParB-like chromosome segregation protein Spo0J